MKFILEKTTFFISLVIIVILLFLAPLIGLDRVSAQSGGQAGQTMGLSGLSGLGGLGLSGMMLGLSYNMAGTGGSLGLINSLGLGVSMGGTGSVGMLGTTNSGITGGAIYGGSGLFGMFGGMYSGLFGMSGGLYGMYGGLPGMSGGMYGMYGGMYGMYGGMYGMYGGLYGMYGGPYGAYGSPYGISGGFSPYAQSYGIRSSAENLANAIVPYFYGTGGSLFTAPLPYGITLHIDVVGYVFDADMSYLPLEEVTVTTKNNLTGYNVKTGKTGRFVIELFPGSYTLIFKKDGYLDTEKRVSVIAGMESVLVYMEKKAPNRAPALDVSSIDLIAGVEFTLDPYAFVNDPDGDQLTFSYSGWKSEYWNKNLPYTPGEDEIGAHDVSITFSDYEFGPITETIVIEVYPGYEIVLYEGFNLISYPFENGDPDFSAFDLLEKLGGFPKVDSIAYYDNPNDRYVTAWYDSNGDPTGDADFPIRIGQGYIVYANENITKKVIDRYDGEDYDLELYQGINLVGIASRPDGYTSYELLSELKGYYVDSIYRYDPFWGDWESTYWLNGSPAGDLFTILKGEGYHIQIKEGN